MDSKKRQPDEGQLSSISEYARVTAKVVAGCYCVIAIILFLAALLVPNDGGVWFLMDYVYWPASLAVSLVRNGILKDLLPAWILHEWPARSLSLLNLFDGAGCVFVGTLWYYSLVKALFFFFSAVRQPEKR
ncbi:MAG: hypothetical protein M3119_00890 [Verrucomicrobiota bacterium]|nr:hypothetical protein [Verrucomicrobiota bacterium]